MEKSKYLIFEYMYIDGCDNKSICAISFSIPSDTNDDEFLKSFIDRIMVSGSENFIADEVGLENMFCWTGDSSRDNCYHQFTDAYIGDDFTSVDYKDGRTVDEFINSYEEAEREEFLPGCLGKTSSQYFEMGKSKCKRDKIQNVRIIKFERLTSFGSSALWYVIPNVVDDQTIEIEEDISRVTISTMEIKRLGATAFCSKVVAHDEGLEDIAREIAELAIDCYDAGIDFIIAE